MKLEEINKIIDEYEKAANSEIGKTTADTMRTLVKRAFEAGVNHGLDTAVKIQNEIFNSQNINS